MLSNRDDSALAVLVSAGLATKHVIDQRLKTGTVAQEP